MQIFKSFLVGSHFKSNDKEFVKIDSTTARPVATFHYIVWNTTVLVERV